MTQPYRYDYKISDIHLDCFDRVKPSVLLYFAQDVASKHAALMGADWETLNQKDLFWAIIRHQIQINRLPVAGETVILETWPMPTTRVAYPRATVGYDREGNVLFRTAAVWVLMNSQTRSMVLPGKSGVVVDGILCGNELALPSSLSPMVAENHTLRTVRYTELDKNLHMNNTRYLDWVDDLLSSQFHREHPARAITICYLSEALEGQEITLNWELTDQTVLTVDAYRKKADAAESRERVFAAQIQF